MSFDPSKPVVTRDGHPARIVATDVKRAGFPIAAAIMEGDAEDIYAYGGDGHYFGDGQSEYHLDLVNVPERVSRFLRLYDPAIKPLVIPHDTAEEARKLRLPSGDTPVGLVQIIYEDGVPVSAEVIDA